MSVERGSPEDRTRHEPASDHTAAEVEWGDHFAKVVFELAPDGMAVTDEYGRMLHVNGRFELLFGFNREELVGRTVEMLLPEQLAGIHRQHRRDYELHPKPRPMAPGQDLWARRRDGTEFLVEIALSPVSTAGGLRTIMAVRASSSPGSDGRRDNADGAGNDTIATELDAGVLQSIVAASLHLHGPLAGATAGQLAVINPVIAQLDDAVRATRRIALDHACSHPVPHGEPGAAPDQVQVDDLPAPHFTASGSIMEYFIDATDVVFTSDHAWAAFAEENDAPELANVSADRDLWSYFDNDEVRELWQHLVARVRAEQVEARVPFRCDAPGLRRWFEMTVTPLGDDIVHFRSVKTFEQVRSASIPLLDLHADRDETADPVLLCSWCARGHDGTRWLDLEDLVSEARITENYRAELATLLALDDAVATIHKALVDTDQLQNTVIIFTSDNGFFHGEHRIPAGKFSLYENDIHVPLIITGGPFTAGEKVPAMTSNVDLSPTILELAEAAPGLPQDGRSLVGLVGHPEAGSDRGVLIENYASTKLQGEIRDQGVRTTRWVYIEHTNGSAELYDLLKDPYELENLADDPALADQRRILEDQLGKLRACHGPSCDKGS